MRHIYILSILFFFSGYIYSQTAADADKLFLEKNYVAAADAYQNLLNRQPKDPLYNYRFGRCCYELNQFEKAIPYLEFAKARYPLANYYLGILYTNTYNYEESVVAYGRYISNLDATDVRIPELTKKMNQSKTAAEMLMRVEDISIIDSTIVDKSDFLRFYHFAADLGTISSSNVLIDSVFVERTQYTTQRKDRTISAKPNNNQLDIFTSYKLLDTWSDETSISPEINTPSNENYPFLMPDGVTLYFASDGEKSIGGYDIFITRFNPNKNDYFTPENIGMPFNSPFNDYMMVVDDVRKIGWFASDRFQPEGKIVVYSFIPNEEKQILRLENLDSLRQFAQLKTFRKATIEQVDFAEITKKQDKEPEYTFVITDNIIYHSLSDFKNNEAADLAAKLKIQKTNLNQMKINLDKLREKYAKSTDDERTEIAPQILSIEQTIATMEKTIEDMTISIRNIEIHTLQQDN